MLRETKKRIYKLYFTFFCNQQKYRNTYIHMQGKDIVQTTCVSSRHLGQEKYSKLISVFIC